MSTICFVTFELHPTTPGGCGVLLHHAACHLLEQGHTVVFALDVPPKQVRKFRDVDRLGLPNPQNCRVHSWRQLASNCKLTQVDVALPTQLRAARYAHAYRKLLEVEPEIDLIEFVDYCGVGYYAFVERVFGREPESAKKPVAVVRLHNPLELIDYFSPTDQMGSDRYMLYSFERGAMRLADTVLTPTESYHRAYIERDYALPPEAVAVSQSPKLPFPRVTRRPSTAKFRIAYVGRMWHFKGVDQLVHAAVALMQQRRDLDFTVDLIGPDSPESPYHNSFTKYLETLIPSNLRPRFTFTGSITHEQIAERLNDALFAVFPNLFESFCYALHEVYDAGVPILANDLAGIRDFFHNKKNCLLYDGTTEQLIEKMDQMIDDDELRESLCRPYAVAEDPLGDIYESPRRLTPTVQSPPGDTKTRSLIVVLCSSNAAQADPTIAALEAQTKGEFDVVLFVTADPDREETAWFLGRPWHARTATGRTIHPSELRTADALLILCAGDRPDPDWHELCAGALARRPNMAFSGTWCRVDGRIATGIIDTAPELAPFMANVPRLRVLHRTEPARLFQDLFDLSLGSLGEIGYCWESVGKWGHGCILPDAKLDAEPEPPEPIDSRLLSFLIARYGRQFSHRLRHITGIQFDAQLQAHIASPIPSPALNVEQKIAAANTLGGRKLATIAVQKLVGRMRSGGKVPTNQTPSI